MRQSHRTTIQPPPYPLFLTLSMLLTITFTSPITSSQIIWLQDRLSESGVPTTEKSRTENSVTLTDPSTVTYQIAGDLCHKWVEENRIDGYVLLSDAPASEIGVGA